MSGTGRLEAADSPYRLSLAIEGQDGRIHSTRVCGCKEPSWANVSAGLAVGRLVDPLAVGVYRLWHEPTIEGQVGKRSDDSRLR
jgi:hypothetical protein